MTERRIEVMFMGVNLGTADDWDSVSDDAIQFYGFVPDKGIKLEEGTLFVDQLHGNIAVYSDNGNEIIQETSFLTVIRKVL